jgi:hypothetical protein
MGNGRNPDSFAVFVIGLLWPKTKPAVKTAATRKRIVASIVAQYKSLWDFNILEAFLPWCLPADQLPTAQRGCKRQ